MTAGKVNAMLHGLKDMGNDIAGVVSFSGTSDGGGGGGIQGRLISINGCAFYDCFEYFSFLV